MGRKVQQPSIGIVLSKRILLRYARPRPPLPRRTRRRDDRGEVEDPDPVAFVRRTAEVFGTAPRTGAADAESVDPAPAAARGGRAGDAEGVSGGTAAGRIRADAARAVAQADHRIAVRVEQSVVPE